MYEALLTLSIAVIKYIRIDNLCEQIKVKYKMIKLIKTKILIISMIINSYLIFDHSVLNNFNLIISIIHNDNEIEPVSLHCLRY